MGEQSASRLEGDRYQHLYSWYEVLRLLDEDCPFESAFVEHPEAGAADDVTLHARPGSGAVSRFVQVKWHVDHRDVYSLEGLAALPPSGAGRSLLQKLFESWRKLRALAPVEVWLVSNWSTDAELGRCIQGADYRLGEAFFDPPPRSALKRRLAGWQGQLGVTRETLRDFCRDLRLRLGFGSISDMEEQVDERMGRLGLRRGMGPRAIALDGVRRWIEEGGDAKCLTRESLQGFIHARELLAPREEAPGVGLWIHGWARRAWERPPTVELDWTAHFHRETRSVPDEDTWRGRLLPELLAARQRLADRPDGTFIDFRGKLPLSTVLAVGFHFPEAGGYRFRAEQPTRGETFLWRSDAGRSARRLRATEREGAPEGRALLVVLQLTGDARADVERFEAEHPGAFRAVLFLEPEAGPGDGAVGSAGDAVAFAVEARELLRRARARWRAGVTHLLLYAPASCCLFLGQRLNAVGTVVAYERTVAGGYAPALTLETG
ncbi:SAVED domain-containing protein [Myxococcus sp. RHSTA-1-4]|uniref:SAVED domain-containing protein n=1 Tax=Myxococcus sp. RHSTA-1-4 TaxID=2874601 RepID=UPI001CBB6684|nr:SAVED domain-containing protein [Myxococcus sp. RHSTA-1-4]MBZ4422698.1 SAVED domain-containing protein [Myxococcus sp. RHSTA-1-4]